ncbi:MAG: DNA polymerase Y family protein [Burkholderiales bacterium]|nr:DNA polymerase Y family protein [Burkholderiales bacterium]|tara:strand:- start:8974 stop:10398 length:1425 start_codon:yes stop_codon:yes gene_type:complete
MLWLCLNFPDLPINIFSIDRKTEKPIAIVESSNTIIAVNKTGQSLGIKNGMSLSAAYGLSNLIEVKYRNKHQEAKKLEEIATSLFKYSSQISINFPNSILIEIGASIKLFCDTKHLKDQIKKTIIELGMNARAAVSPTPLSAVWLASQQIEITVLSISDLPKHLDSLPISTIGSKNTLCIQPDDVGIKTIGELASVSRSAVTQRWGPHVIDQLDRAFGRKPDPCPLFILPRRFNTEISLNLPASSVTELLFGINRIIHSMTNYLQAKQRGVIKFELTITNEENFPHNFNFKLSVPSRDPKHLTNLVQERLNRETIPSRIESIQLKSTQELSITPSNYSLIHQSEHIEPNRGQLIDQLQARLGEKSVYGITVYADHRPEKSWRATIPGGQRFHGPVNHRPSWLLRTPKALPSVSGIPQLHGPLTILNGPERIETGWWDEKDIKRDYFLALTQDHSQVWVYKDIKNQRWFLHGIFS